MITPIQKFPAVQLRTMIAAARDRDALPTLPEVPFGVIEAAYPTVAPAECRFLAEKGNPLIAAFRNLSKGSSGVSESAGSSGWKQASSTQRKVALDMVASWASWLPDMEDAPTLADELTRALGFATVSYRGVVETEPEPGRVDSGGRPLLAKVAICPIDVEEVALPFWGRRRSPSSRFVQKLRLISTR